ncbi:hypothetical protein ETU10_07175 [Apibacter muscae]|uniref:hypothetical protein n=1 Tax=Apibacter muscae TaxID=2509004 RepID=UPI0011AC8EEF|nr:hypothetical protein [Apibacter muscae]TWP23497.1 hypothetical protein ETU10_07175 [Apibacter muscae]
MPHLWNDILVVTKEELVPQFWNCIQSLQSEIWRYKAKPYGIKQVQKGGNGRMMLISFESLSNEIQEALGDPRKITNPLELYYQTDVDAVTYYKEFKRLGKYLELKEQERYITNASVLQAVIQLEAERARMRKSSRGVLQTLCTDVINFNEVLKKKHNCEHNLPSHPARFNQTYRLFKSDLNYFSLIKDPYGKGKQNARIVTDETLTILNGLFANVKHKPTPTEIYRYYDAFLNGYAEVYNEQTGELYNPKEFKKLSESTVRHYITKWENKIGTYRKRAGDRVRHMEQTKPHHQLQQPKYSGSLVSIDDRQPPFAYNGKKRVWFYNAVDLASGCLIAWVYGKSKEGIIIEFYRQLVRNCAEWGVSIPDGLECESNLNSSFKDTFLKKGYMFQNVRIEPNNPRGKAIERYNGAFRYELEKQREGWIARPKAKSESNQSGTGKVLELPYERIIDECLGDIETWNNMPSKQDSTLTRWEYFLQNQNPDLKPINWAGFMPFLGYKEKSSCSAGYIRLQGRKRAIAENGEILTGAGLIEKLKQIEGKELDIYWLDDNEGKVLKALVYYQGRFICEVMQMPTYNKAVIEQTDADLEAKKLQDSYVMTVENFGKHQARALAPINIIDNTPKTLNNKFQIRNKTRIRPSTQEIKILEDEADEVVYTPSTHSTVRGWRSNFQS